MQCPVCHTEVGPQNVFCNQCGAPLSTGAGTVPFESVPVGAGVPPTPPYAVPPPPAYAGQPVAASTGLSENAAAAIAYITIIPAIIFLVIEPYNRMPLVKFHSWQSIALFVVAFVLQAVISICEMALHFIPGIIILFGLVHLAVGLCLFLVWLFIILKASKGEWFKLPVIGDFAEKQARN
jgi:uncharacterized membrane protein